MFFLSCSPSRDLSLRTCARNIESPKPKLGVSSLSRRPPLSLLSPPRPCCCKVDTDGNGDISFDEFVTMMQMGEVETDFSKEINEAFKFFDKDGDGEVSDQSAKAGFPVSPVVFLFL